MKKPLTFIDLRDIRTDRQSSLSVYGNRDDGALRVVGNLEHNASIVPGSVGAARQLIAWLEEWIEKND